MNKNTRNILIVVVIILLVFGIVWAIYGSVKPEPVNANTAKDNILDDANTGLENFINDIFDDENNEEQNNEKNTTTSNTQSSNTQGQKPSTSKDDNSSTVNQTTPGEKKAIELVKAEWKKVWGSLDGVSFNNVMIQGDGKYVVSVNDSKTTKLVRTYVVDTAKGLVEEK